MKQARHIVAIGGKVFYQDPALLLLEKFIVSLSSKQHPSIALIPTASADNEHIIKTFYEVFEHLGCKTSHLSLFKPHTADLNSYILEQDIIFVSGGNTKNMLALWREWNLVESIRKSYETGTVLAGSSAGSICWFEEGVTDSSGVSLEKLTCLGFLRGSNCPHYDSEIQRRPRYHELLAVGMKPGLAAEDGVGLHFVNESFVEAVSNEDGKKAFEVNTESETLIPVRYLGNS
ncbi:MAG: peptidase E [Bdellovibrionota bacterium]